MRIVLILAILALFTACDKTDPILDNGVPKCITEKIEEFKMSIDPCDQIGASVKEFKFQGNVVYAFDMGQCISDGSSMIFDKECTEICVLGTIVGITDCRGESFDNAEEVRVLWQQ